jgi:tetratricopeptide (TPR) repeat protein
MAYKTNIIIMKREPIYRRAILAIIAALCFILPNANAQSIEKGLHLLDMDQYHNAISVFKEATKQTPANADAWYYLGICYTQLENIDSASIAFNAGLAADSKNPANVSGQAIVQHFKKNDVQAKATFATAAKMAGKKYPNGLVSVLKGYAICGYPIDPFIDGVYKKAVANDMKNPNSYLAWGEIQYNAKEYGAASTAYQYAYTNDPKNVQAHYLLGKMYHAARNQTAALTELDAALEIDPMYVPAVKEKGDVYYEMDKFDDAATWYDKYIQMTEETVASLTRYANVLFFDKKYEKAHEVLVKVLKLDPNNVNMLQIMGWVSFETKHDADGLNALGKFFQLKGDTAKYIHPLNYEYYAKLLKNNGKDSLAIVYYQKRLTADSSRKSQVFDDIATLYINQKKFVEGAQYMERSQQTRSGIDALLQNKIADAYLSAAKLLAPSDSLMKKQYYVKADSAYSKICQAIPNKYVGYYKRARLAYLTDPDGSKGIAKPYYEKTLQYALADKPEDNKIIILECYQYQCSQAGLLYLAALKSKDPKEKEKAPQLKVPLMELLNKMLAVDPANSYALENIKSLNPPVKKPAAGAVKK